MSRIVSVDIHLEDDLLATVEVEYTPGEDPTGPTYDCGGTPGVGATYDILTITVGHQTSTEPGLVMTETLMNLGFDDMYADQIAEAVDAIVNGDDYEG